MIRLPGAVPRVVGPAETICKPGSLQVIKYLPGTVAVICSPRTSKVQSVEASVTDDGAYERRLVVASWNGEPWLSDITGAVRELEEFQPDWVVAVGGGSIIDGAKLAWTFYEHPHLEMKRLETPFGIPGLRVKARFAAVPTTAGSGSEASSAATYLDPGSRRKIPAVTHDFLPDLVLLDANLTTDLPPANTAMSALDALAHLIEGYVSLQRNSLIDPIAETAVRMFVDWLPTVKTNPSDTAAREKLLIASHLAGQVQNMRLVGPAHAIAHQIAEFSVPHGLATGLLLPVVMQFNCEADDVLMAYNTLARSAGLSDGNALREFVISIPPLFGLAEKLSLWKGVPERLERETLESVAQDALSDMLNRVFPRKLTFEQAMAMIESVW